MKRVTSLPLAIVTLSLAACSNGPSEAEMQRAYELRAGAEVRVAQTMRDVQAIRQGGKPSNYTAQPPALKSFKKVSGVQSNLEPGNICTFEITFAGGDSRIEKGRFYTKNGSLMFERGS